MARRRNINFENRFGRAHECLYLCNAMKYSIIIPVYNRPDEVEELLDSIALQQLHLEETEVIVVEDGSSLKCDKVADLFRDRLNIKYYEKSNSGPGPSRNYGARKSTGEYLIILDSDTVLPPSYLEAIDSELQAHPCDAFGGPDMAHKDFSPVQKAINYGMTSFFTTGGIRGGKKKLDKFYPRSFNMGIKREVFDALKGFSNMRFGEDIDLSLRIFENGYECRLFPSAWLWHKRRTDLKKFFKQVYNSGIARINLTKRHPGSLKIVHTLPALFTIASALMIVGIFFCKWSIVPLAAYALLILTDASIKEKSLKTGGLAVAASFVQLVGYGSGFIGAAWQRLVLKKGEYEAYRDTFYE